ncbi:MAG: alpha/beta fold hydrolase [Spirochaetes bacterium]|nr:alpha/beta fold hydrolase [Spirochaetota bacterium]
MKKRTLAFVVTLPIACIVGCIVLSALYNSFASARWLRTPLAPGTLYDVEGRGVYATVKGEGPVTVVIEGDVGEPSMTWWDVQERLASRARVITYDRAGYGWSESGAGPRTGGRIVSELKSLLAATRCRGPYLLVGHGLGGLYALHFARMNPGSIRGVLLINPLTIYEEDVKKETPSIVYQNLLNRSGFIFFSYGLSCSGLSRTLRVVHLPGVSSSLVKPIRGYFSLVRTNKTMVDEYIEGFRPSVEEVNAEGPFPPVPLVVLGYNASDLADNLYQFDLSYDEVERTVNAKRMALKRTAALSPRGVYIETAPGVDTIQLTDPGYLVRIITSLLP